MEVGSRVLVRDLKGTVRFIGQTKFGGASKTWIGIELDQAQGKNDGSVEDVRYFTCPPNHGLFVDSATGKTKLLHEENPAKTTASSSSTISSIPAISSKTASVTTENESTDTSTTRQEKPALSFRTSSKTQALKARKAALDARIHAARRSDAVLTGSPRAAPPSSIPPPDRRGNTPAHPVTTATQSTPARSDARRIARIQELEKQVVDLEKRLSSSLQSNEKLAAELGEKEEKKSEVLKGEVEAEGNKERKEVEELKAKVAALEKERSMERANQHKLRVEAETQHKVGEKRLEREVTQLKAELQAAKEDMEGLSLDKEQFEVEKDLAEEKAEDLQVELEQAKQAQALLQERVVEMQVLIDSKECLTDEEKSKAVLLEQNSKLREALKRLHTSSLEEKQELHKELKAKEKQVVSLEKTEGEAEKLRSEKQNLEEQVEHLKGIVDTNEAHGSMIETLSERNLELSESNEELQRQAQELEEMREIADELEKHHAEYEMQLLQDVDQKSLALQRTQAELAKASEDLTAAEEVQRKMKQLLAQAEAEKQKLKFEVESLEQFKSSLLEKSSSERNLNIKTYDTGNEIIHLKIMLKNAETQAAQAAYKLGFFESFLSSTVLFRNQTSITFLNDVKHLENTSKSLVSSCTLIIQDQFQRCPSPFFSEDVVLCGYQCLSLSRTVKHKLDLLCNTPDYDQVLERWQPSVKRIVFLVDELYRSLQSLYATLDERGFNLCTFKLVDDVRQALDPFLATVTAFPMPDDSTAEAPVRVQSIAGLSVVGQLYGGCFALVRRSAEAFHRHREAETDVTAVGVLATVLPKELETFTSQTLKSISENVEIILENEIELDAVQLNCLAKAVKILGGVRDALESSPQVPVEVEVDSTALANAKAVCANSWLTKDSSSSSLAGAWACASKALEEELKRQGESSKETEALKGELNVRGKQVLEQESKIEALDHLNSQLQYKMEAAREQARQAEGLKSQMEEMKQRSAKAQEELNALLGKAKEEASQKHAQLLALEHQFQNSSSSNAIPRVLADPLAKSTATDSKIVNVLRLSRQELLAERSEKLLARVHRLPKLHIAGSSPKSVATTWSSKDRTNLRDVRHILDQAALLQSKVRVVQLSDKSKDEVGEVGQWISQKSAIRTIVSKLRRYESELCIAKKTAANARLHVGSITIPDLSTEDTREETREVNLTTSQLSQLLRHPYLTSICT